MFPLYHGATQHFRRKIKVRNSLQFAALKRHAALFLYQEELAAQAIQIEIPQSPAFADKSESHVTDVGFEPTPLRTGARSQRLRPLGQTVFNRTLARQFEILASLMAACVHKRVHQQTFMHS